jgi:hypothetical protein
MLQSLGWLKGKLKKENLGLPWFTFTYIIIHLHMCLSSCTGFPVNSPETTAMLLWNSTGQRNQSLSARRWSRKTEVAWQPWGTETIFCGPKIEAYASKLR